MTSIDAESVTENPKPPKLLSKLPINDLLLVGVLVFSLTLGLLIVSAYFMPSQQLDIPGLQPVVRVADVDNFPVGTSRRVSWGDRLILVVHRTSGEYFAVQGTASSDGCLLRWDADAMRVVSPCSYVVYDLSGNVVAGLTTAPLAQYRVFEREAVVYVTEANHGS